MKIFKITLLAAGLACLGLGSVYAADASKKKDTKKESAKAEVEYMEVTQADLGTSGDEMNGKPVVVEGQFLFKGSDFCFQIRKTEINTRDYFCFALGPVNIVRFYLKKDHEQVTELLELKRGKKVRAYGVYDSTGNDLRYVLVDRFEVVEK